MKNPNLRVHIPTPWAQCLQLFESNETPHTYGIFTQYSISGHKPYNMDIVPLGSTWDQAWQMFQYIFKKKCGIEWCSTDNLNSTNLDDEYFQYLSPKNEPPNSLTSVATVVLDSKNIKKSIDARAVTPIDGW